MSMQRAGVARGLGRREAVGVIAAGAAGLVGGLAGCARRASAAGEVVLYSSADDFVLREVVAAFERDSGITVRTLGDTEATKTTGLLERLISERERPVADVWWSSEPFGTIRLAGMGLFEPAGIEPGPVVDPRLAGSVDSPDGVWFGFAARARVLGVREGRYPEGETARRLSELTDARFRGRVGIARTRFGTTRGHMSAIAAVHGEAVLESWLRAMVGNGLRVFDGNSTVVRAIAEAEIDVGLTDTDDVWAAQRNGWPVAAVYEADDGAGAGGVPPSLGPMLMPNTAARVRGGPNPEQAKRLMEFLLAGPAEEILAASDSHNMPVRHGPFPDLARYAAPGGWLPDLARVAESDGAAMAVCDRVLGEG
ncbi:MAG: substrate-binding domain-containing protein [Phycisphaerales bacterium]|nr:substrate-binding domain-containing protein [Phycisphaerales bacterium]